MASLNKVLSNPGFKFNRADSDALANVWRSIDAQDMAINWVISARLSNLPMW
uniref:Uncharacterized protein n=1 Tax=Escherichia coli TaxID=562 RepID=A0A3G4RPV6_ECOLX|nr:hypothetical protein D0356_00192 [Escherichia coli]